MCTRGACRLGGLREVEPAGDDAFLLSGGRYAAMVESPAARAGCDRERAE